jgi:hypothetical protein
MYVNGRGQWMWAGYTSLPTEPAAQTKMVVEHRSTSRNPENMAVKQAYYRARMEHRSEDEFADSPEVAAWTHAGCSGDALTCPYCADALLAAIAAEE